MSKPKIAVLHAFFKADCKGGGERLVFDIRDYYGADLFAGAIDLTAWGRECAQKDSFAQRLWDDRFSFTYLHQDSPRPWWSRIQRQLYFLLSPQINKLKDYDIVIFSGNIGFVPTRLRGARCKKVMYCHTPPRPITDQLEAKIQKSPAILRPLLRLGAKLLVAAYRWETETMDIIITNSTNTQKRLKTYVGLDSTAIYPAVNTKRFQYIGQQDYYLSYARLEEIKRIPLIIEAFGQMPDKKLIIASSGPLKDWVSKEIKQKGYTNITYEGIVSDERLAELVGNCVAGIYIPIDEDAGMTQCELMAAGKPVIGVNDGGLKETVVDQKTGVLLSANPSLAEFKNAILEMTPERAFSMKNACIEQAEQFDTSHFFEKMDEVMNIK